MYKTLSILTLCCFIAIKLSAQAYEKSFPAHSYYLSETMDIVWKKPRGFIWENTGISLWSQGNRDLGATYEGTMRSKDGNCFVLYPSISLLGGYTTYHPESGKEERQIVTRKQMMKDINDALSSKESTVSATFDWKQYVTTLASDDAPFDADTVFLAQIPLKKPYQDKYLYCTGIYAWKEGRVPMIFRCFFTEEGKKKEKKFLSKFYKMVRYKHNENWYFDTDKATKIRYEQYLKTKKKNTLL